MAFAAPVVAGILSTVLFVISYLPMLAKAVRSKDLRSYSLGNLVIANVGNAVHSVYVFSLPLGPIWFLHSFYLLSTAAMLVWHRRYVRPRGTAEESAIMADVYTTSLTDGVVRGAIELEPTDRGLQPHRLPARARAQWPDPQLLRAESQPSGVRLAFRTAATVVELETAPTRFGYRGLPPRPDGVYDLLVDGERVAGVTADGGDRVTLDPAGGPAVRDAGPVATVRFAGLPGREKDVELWLPHLEGTELVALRTDAPVHVTVSDRRTWVHHGSSISHGSNASRPTGTWASVAARAGGVELVNLGFGSSALLDPFTARAMRDTAADLLSVKIGINVVNADLMRRRAFGPAVHGFLDTVREGHPTAPLLVVTPLYCRIHEETPGPSAFDPVAMAEGRMVFTATGDPAEVPMGRLTLRVVREELAKVVAQRAAEDPHLHLLDGLDLYGADDYSRLPLPDELHPDPATHELVGERFGRLVFGAEGAFG